MSMILGGEPRVTKDYTVGAEAQSGVGAFGGADGYPVRTPVIDLVEIGAGGGSIAWVDSGGALRVGPRSSGAEPGPACYGLGGTQPTITDANLVLGRLNPEYFAGGAMPLDPALSAAAIKEHCARPLGMDVEATADGIIEIANSMMVGALRLVSVQRGHDPRDFLLVAFGGAGPAHAARIAQIAAWRAYSFHRARAPHPPWASWLPTFASIAARPIWTSPETSTRVNWTKSSGRSKQIACRRCGLTRPTVRGFISAGRWRCATTGKVSSWTSRPRPEQLMTRGCRLWSQRSTMNTNAPTVSTSRKNRWRSLIFDSSQCNQ